MKEVALIILGIMFMMFMSGMAKSQMGKSNFFVICEAKGGTKEFCENSWNSHKE